MFTALLRDTPVTRVFTPLGLTVATHSRYERGYTTQKLAVRGHAGLGGGAVAGQCVAGVWSGGLGWELLAFIS